MTPKNRGVSWGWKLPVLCTLETGNQTFGELWSKLPGISPKALSDALRELEACALIGHGARETAEIEYVLTDGGAALLPQIHSIIDSIVNDAASHATPEQFLHLQQLFSRQPRVRNSAEAIRRAADKLRRLIAIGALKPGERLPSAEKIAAMMKLTVSQAQQVYDSLKSDGVITTKRRNGTFVPEDLQIGV
ncbi:MAG TPA: GntR family transcriptional regulator [Thermoanaerobaculia bacterium]|nr:GntR family transcriptional regulator [Thermoanaerobaculia bacterium]